ncbi:MAG TPA: arginase family protein, partial [Nitrospiria bacterium]|nr:arginase family protein [Nitrospiria bacterium]
PAGPVPGDLEGAGKKRRHPFLARFVEREDPGFFLNQVIEVSLSVDAAVSSDLDAVAQAYAPGVSAPSPEGLTPEEAAQAALLAGEEPKVRYFDIMELNPIFDHDNRTARLAVAILHAFLCGVARRTRKSERGIGFRPER